MNRSRRAAKDRFARQAKTTVPANGSSSAPEPGHSPRRSTMAKTRIPGAQSRQAGSCHGRGRSGGLGWPALRRRTPSQVCGGRGPATVFPTSGPDGSRLTDKAAIERIRSLAIPPAYTDVWIARLPTVTSRPPDATPRAASSIGTTRGFAKSATAPNMSTSSPSPTHCQRCEQRCASTWRSPACRAKKSWPPSSTCWTRP